MEPEDAPAGAPADPVTGLPADVRQALEAIVMVAADPVPPQMLAQLLEVPLDAVEEACTALAASYQAEGRGFVLARVAGGYRFQSHPDAAAYVERYVLEGQSARLSSAALETLAIVAYKQPLSRAQIASIRGVNVDGVVRTLVHRGLVDEVARDQGPGQAVLYGTTPLFLERLGLDALDQLPPIASFVPGADVVEALEHGLRLDATGDEDPPEDGAGDSPPEPEAPEDLDDAAEDAAGRIEPASDTIDLSDAPQDPDDPGGSGDGAA